MSTVFTEYWVLFKGGRENGRKNRAENGSDGILWVEQRKTMCRVPTVNKRRDICNANLWEGRKRHGDLVSVEETQLNKIILWIEREVKRNV